MRAKVNNESSASDNVSQGCCHIIRKRICLYSACIIVCSSLQACCCHENLKFLFLADQYDSSSGSLQLISIKPMAAPPTYSHPASSDRSQDSAILNGEVRLDFIRDSLRRKPLTDHSLLTDLLMHFTLKKGCGYPIARSLLIG